jgi:hypothetical protein
MRIIILDAIIPSEKDQDDIDNIHLNQPSTSTVYSPNVELLEELPVQPNSEKCTSTSWSTYTPSMLKAKPNRKLEITNRDKKQNKPSTFKKKIGHKKMTLNEELIREKLEFVKLQKEKFLEEHNAKMKLLKLQMKQFQKDDDTDEENN